MIKIAGYFDKLVNSALAGIGAGQITLAVLTTANGQTVWIAIPSALIGGFCLWVCGWRMHRRYYSRLSDEMTEEMRARVPRDVRLERNEDGSATAFCTMLNGDPVLVTIPEEVCEHGLQSAQAWLIDELMSRESA